jgi:gallate decarboxylase subunit D
VKKFLVDVSKGRFKIYGLVQEMGEDLLVSIWGGTRPHIGAVGIAIPRPSLRDPKRWSASSSNFTFVGHKEDTLVKRFSEDLAARLRRNVVVVAGIHWDRMTPGEIKAVQNLTKEMSGQILKELMKRQTVDRPPKS